VQYGEDADTWIRLSLKSKIAYINKPLSNYHMEAENRSTILHKQNRNNFDIYYPVKELDRYLHAGEFPESQRQAAIEYIALFKLPLAQKYLYHGNAKKAKEIIMSCEGTRKHIIKKYWLLICAYIPPAILNPLIRFKHYTINSLFHFG